MPSVIIGRDAETGQEIRIDDIERCSGLYILGRSGTGKTTLIKNIIAQDIANGHGVFFLDPAGDAIEDLKKRIPANRQNDVIILDPSDEMYSCGMNLLSCADPDNMTQRSRTFAQAIDIFKKLFANLQTEELDILLNQYLRNSFFPLIANQGYTISEIPLFLEEKQFRDRLLQNPSVRPEVVRFWHNTFDRLRSDVQREEIASTKRRLDQFQDYDEVRHIVGQSMTSIDFTKIMDTGKILFVKLSKTLPGDAWRIIGTILVSNLVHAVLQREQIPQEKRRHCCIFVDEFHNFATSDDFAILFTQARKYAIATTIAHQERYGQFADNKRISGATDAAVNKIFFRVSVRDAQEQAPEFAQKSDDTKTRMGGELVVSPHAIEDIWERGHTDKDVMYLRDKYFWIVDLLKTRPQEDFYVFDPQKIQNIKDNGGRLHYEKFDDWFEYRATADMLKQGISLLNKYYYDCMQNGFKEQPITNAELELFLQIIECFSGVFGFRPTFEADIPDDMRERFVRLMTEKQDREILNIKNRIEQGLLSPSLMMHHARPDAWAYSHSPEGKELELWNVIDRENPALKRKWTIEQIPRIIFTGQDLDKWQRFGLEVFTPSEIAEFIKWQKRPRFGMEQKPLRELITIVANIVVATKEYDENQRRVYRAYTAIMAYLPMQLRFGENYVDLPVEKIEPYLQIVTERIVWQLTELQYFLTYCLRILPSILARNPIKIQSAQYEEEPKREKTQGEMITEMEQELIGLPPHTAYVKSAWKGKIQTSAVERGSRAHLVDVGKIALHNAIAQRILIPRSVVEEEIRERQERWRRGPGGEPPPTYTGGDRPPSLPSGSSERTSEPPPTYYALKTPLETNATKSIAVNGQYAEVNTEIIYLKTAPDLAATWASPLPLHKGTRLLITDTSHGEWVQVKTDPPQEGQIKEGFANIHSLRLLPH